MSNDDITPEELEASWDKDKERLKRLATGQYESGGVLPSTAGALEGLFWGLTAVTGIAFVAIMPWIGPDGVLTGEQWLGAFPPFVLLFAAVAFVIRKLPRDL